MRVVVLILSLLAACLGAVTSASADGSKTVQDIDWASRPTVEMLADAYPSLPMRLMIEGRAVIRCDVSDLGVLEACEVVSETPQGMGFGTGALSLAHRFRMKPKTVNGEPFAGGGVAIPVAFRLPAGAPRPLPFSTSENRLSAARAVWPESERADWIVSGFDQDLDVWRPTGADAALLEQARAAVREAVRRIAPDWASATLAHDAAAYELSELKALADFSRTSGGKTWLGLSVRPPVRFDRAVTPYLIGVISTARSSFCATRLCTIDALEVDAARAEPGIVDPPWLQTPTYHQLTIAQPRLARTLRLAGLVRLNCQLSSLGAPEGCKIAGETPQNLGFGAAALTLAPYFKLAPELIGQGAARERVSFVVPFPGMDALPGRPPPADFSGEKSGLALELAELHLRETDGEQMFLRPLVDIPETDTMPEDARSAALLAIKEAAKAELRPLAELAAANYAEALSADQMRQVLSYLRTPMGRRTLLDLRETDVQRYQSINRYYIDQIAIEAGRILCKRRGCDTKLPPPQIAAPTP